MGTFLTVPGGREYLVRVPGSAQSPLSDAELARVLNWMIRAFGPPAIAADFDRGHVGVIPSDDSDFEFRRAHGYARHGRKNFNFGRARIEQAGRIDVLPIAKVVRVSP